VPGVCDGNRSTRANTRLCCHADIAGARLVPDAGRWRRTGTETSGEFWRDRCPVRRVTDGLGSGWSALGGLAQSIALGKSLDLAATELDQTKDAEYPRRLLEIYDPPLVLYIKGNAKSIDKPGIAIVGTRHPTPYGIGIAERLSCDLAARGLVVFSRMARGVDTAAHRGALNSHGLTVAICGTGIDEVYPKENRKIADQILASGRHSDRIPAGHISRATEFSQSRPHHQRHRHWGARHRGWRIQRHSRDCVLRVGAGARGICCARQRHFRGDLIRLSNRARRYRPHGKMCGKLCPPTSAWP
jgi:DNA recombination-mediator protein A